MLDENQTVEWTPPQYGKRMDDWLRNMGDWNISRRRFYGLPLPFYPCDCGHVNVIGSREELQGPRGRRDRRPGRTAPPVDRPRADPLREVRQPGAARRRGGRRVAGRGHRPVLDARLGQRPMARGGLCHRRRARSHDRRPARSRLLGAVVPRDLGDGDARADPALVLLDVLHVDRAHRPRAIPEGADLREAARRRRARDARILGQSDFRRRRVRAHGRRRHALDVLAPAADPEHPVRLRAGRRDQAPAAHAVELGSLPHRLRRHRGVPTGLRGPRRRRRRRRAAFAGPVAAGTRAATRRRGRDGLRLVPHRRRRSCRRVVRGRPLELVHPPLAQALLLVGRGGVPRAVDRARAARARVRADHAVPRRAPVAAAGHRTARGCPSSVFLAGFPRVAPGHVDEALLVEIEQTGGSSGSGVAPAQRRV